MLEAQRRERELHARFAAQRRFRPYYAGAEWFNASQELRDFIRSETLPPSERGVVATAATPGAGRP